MLTGVPTAVTTVVSSTGGGLDAGLGGGFGFALMGCGTLTIRFGLTIGTCSCQSSKHCGKGKATYALISWGWVDWRDINEGRIC